MDFIEFVEKSSPVPLNKYQKQILCLAEKAYNENSKLILCYPRITGREMILRLRNEWIQEKSKQDGITVREGIRQHSE